MILETERLILREMVQSDFPLLCKHLQDADVMYAWGHAFSDAEVQEGIDQQFQRYKKDGFGIWAVILKENGELIGQCGLSMQPCEDKEVLEIGYIFQKNYWHKGYAAEAAIACKKYAFDQLGADEVFSLIRDTNIASQHVAKRNGMNVRGTFVKHYRGVDMPHMIFSVKRIADLTQIPGIGKKMAQHLTSAGYPNIESLKGQDPEQIYTKDCLFKGFSVDRCALYCYRLAVHYADNDGQLPPHKQNWWDWKD